jgi:hypothetical protein
MKIQIWKGMLAAAIFSVVLSSPAKAQDGDNDGCSNATLHGDYAFAIHGESLGVFVPQTTGAPKLVPFASPVLIDGVAITHFDGNGILKQVDFSMHNGTSVATPTAPPTENGFRAEETGTYSVKSDCTGTTIRPGVIPKGYSLTLRVCDSSFTLSKNASFSQSGFYGGSPMRRTRAAKRGSDRNGSQSGSTLR